MILVSSTKDSNSLLCFYCKELCVESHIGYQTSCAKCDLGYIIAKFGGFGSPKNKVFLIHFNISADDKIISEYVVEENKFELWDIAKNKYFATVQVDYIDPIIATKLKTRLLNLCVFS